jgi:hypothetical protein
MMALRTLALCSFAVFAAPACVASVTDGSGDGSDTGSGDGSDTGSGDVTADPPDQIDPTTVQPDALTQCNKLIKVSLRTNYGMETIDPTRQHPNKCWVDDDPTTPGLQIENIVGKTWRRCNQTMCEPTTGKLHWYFDDTSVGQTTLDKAEIARVHNGMGDIKGTVDMVNRGAGWNYFQMDAGGATNIINRWNAETHMASGDHQGCQFQENGYIDEWSHFEAAMHDPRIRPQLVVISADHVCPVDGRPMENCPQAYLQIKHACSLIGSGRTLSITAEGGLKLQYGHCLGDVIEAINDCTCKTAGGCH